MLASVLPSALPFEQEPSEQQLAVLAQVKFQLVVLMMASELQADLVLQGLVSPFVPEPPFERVSLLGQQAFEQEASLTPTLVRWLLDGSV